MNYDYSYDTTYIHKTIGNDGYYQFDFCRVFLCKQYNDIVLETQDSLLEKFKDNVKFKNILHLAKTKNFNIPIKMDDKNVFCFLFSYDYFHYIHKCLQDLFKTNDISDINYDKLINILKK